MTDRSRQLLKGALLIGVSATLLAVVLTQVDLAVVGQILAGADVPLLIVALLFSTASFAILPTLRWRGTLRAIGFALPFRSLLFARVGGQPFKFTIPLKGGEAFRAIYVRRRHGVPLTSGAASILFDMFLVAVGQLTFLCIGVALAGEAVRRALLPTIALFAVGLLLSSRHVQALMLRVAAMLSERLHTRVAQLAHGFLRFPIHTKLKLTLISYAVEFAEIFSMVLCCQSLGVPIPFWAIMAYMPIVMGITLIPVTLRGLGTRELAILVLFAGHASPEQLASAALLFTLLEFILPAVIGCFFLSPFLASLARTPHPERAPAEEPNAPGPVWVFLSTNKRWWLLPALLVFAAFALMVWLTSTGGVTPFVY